MINMQPTQNVYGDEEANHTIQKKYYSFLLVQDLHECANVVCTKYQYSTLIYKNLSYLYNQ